VDFGTRSGTGRTWGSVGWSVNPLEVFDCIPRGTFQSMSEGLSIDSGLCRIGSAYFKDIVAEYQTLGYSTLREVM